MRSLFQFSAALSIAVSLTGLPALALETAAPKLGPNATPITADQTYLRGSDAPDYWAFSPFVKPQFTSSACSIASVTAAINGLKGLPSDAEDKVLSQPELLEKIGDPLWAKLSAEEGDGVTFAQLATYASAAVQAADLQDYEVESYQPKSADEASLSRVRDILAANEKSASDALLVYFNQGVVTGDWDGPHVSLIGAYDADKNRVLVLEVDQDWYIPYWTPTSVLLEAMIKPTSAEHGPLEGETGGLVWLKQ